MNNGVKKYMPAETVPCRVCGDPTEMRGTKLCDRCWELKNRIRAAPELARRILAQMEAGDA